MRVSELAKKLEVTADTVRYYTRIGYLNPTTEPGNNYRDYGPQEERSLRFILSTRRLGFTVDDTGQLLNHADQGKSHCPLARDLITRRLNETERRFREMKILRERMATAVSNWSAKPNREPNGDMICHLIEDWDSPESSCNKDSDKD